MNSVVIGIEYDEESIESYKSCTVRGGPQGGVLFQACSGDVTIDFAKAVEFASEQETEVFCSSSVDHFLMDAKGAYHWSEEKGTIVVGPGPDRLGDEVYFGTGDFPLKGD